MYHRLAGFDIGKVLGAVAGSGIPIIGGVAGIASAFVPPKKDIPPSYQSEQYVPYSSMGPPAPPWYANPWIVGGVAAGGIVLLSVLSRGNRAQPVIVTRV